MTATIEPSTAEKPDAKPRGGVKVHFIKPLQGQFNRAPGLDPSQYFESLKKALRKYGNDVLDEAAWRLISKASSDGKKPSRIFPQLPVCIQVCEKVQAELSPASDHAADRQRDVSEGYKLPEDVAVRILISNDRQLAARAIKANWQNELIEYIRTNKHVPTARNCRLLVEEYEKKNERLAMSLQEAEAAFAKTIGARPDDRRQLPDRHPVQIMVTAIQNRRRLIARKINEALGIAGGAAQ